ncbi:hypothetical protein E2320_011327, partial [Naja naja]
TFHRARAHPDTGAPPSKHFHTGANLGLCQAGANLSRSRVGPATASGLLACHSRDLLASTHSGRRPPSLPSQESPTHQEAEEELEASGSNRAPSVPCSCRRDHIRRLGGLAGIAATGLRAELLTTPTREWSPNPARLWESRKRAGITCPVRLFRP